MLFSRLLSPQELLLRLVYFLPAVLQAVAVLQVIDLLFELMVEVVTASGGVAELHQQLPC